MAEVEETIKRLLTHKGVRGIIVYNNEGIPIRSTVDNATAVQHASLLHRLTTQAKNVIRDIDSTNELCFLRLQTKKHEIMLAPDKDYYLIVIKAPES